MNYFLTGGTGFIGRFFVENLLSRGGTIHLLVRDSSRHKLDELKARFPVAAERIIGVSGDITANGLGIAATDIAQLKGRIDHFFHFAAIYDMGASEESQRLANVNGTLHAVRTAEALGAGCFHHVSSVAVSGLYRGSFREDMFEEAENLDHPYFRTKHDSEKMVREKCGIPYRIYRPGAVIGHSRTGEIDKIDGPYYSFKMLQRIRNTLPKWMPLIGIESGLNNLVPVDYVVNAIDYLAHLEGHDGGCFHITDTEHYSTGQMMNIFAEAAHAPQFTLRFDPKIFNFMPTALADLLAKLPPVKRLKSAIFERIGMPESAAILMKYETRYDSRQTQRLLEGSGIKPPKLASYAARIWDYWERNLDPDLFIDHTLEGQVRDRVVLITGGSAGIGKALAIRLAASGAKVVITARKQEALEETCAEIRAAGGQSYSHVCDGADFEAVDRVMQQIETEHGGVDILINNAGRSIRRSVSLAYDRFHDFERTMQLNYFGALRVILRVLPGMDRRRHGHVINISSMGVLGHPPRFSAYIASKSALEAFSLCAAAEYSDRNIHFTNINMPLVRTAMIAPTKIYEYAPALEVDEAIDLIVDAIIHKKARVATGMGRVQQLIELLFPKFSEITNNATYRMFPDSEAAKGLPAPAAPPEATSEQIAMAALMKGVHF
ncbi:MAG: SDR family oxidoreductase [Gammaproteobacteria bacterium]|jgi:NAD(P)-dependent dehydrogenase (short-subunit alcohol dehydrogenase family)|nr:SDR family oxidoreductase [Gammaproteobacteria bacterium]MBP6052959.1 SDR family oxidoreductase [Pseudomonadales bacterium]MBK7169309.1 SDR family oxidoreductase [Gammaproteobacteria bacterium]MBK7522484.1 SDR family oxidoreductase [Gammaproteobacteria bacterium]MBK7727187.1 SDR family oxidoreductase [Gammaproteobacteria bacterium]